jgi:hypothetical protein
MALISGLAGFSLPLDDPEGISNRAEMEPLTETKLVISDLERELRPYWKCFAVRK